MTHHPVPANHNHWWLHGQTSDTLHAVRPDDWSMEAWEDNECLPLGVWARCGQYLKAGCPGPFTRLGARRCPACCKAVGIPFGNGTPANEASVSGAPGEAQ